MIASLLCLSAPVGEVLLRQKAHSSPREIEMLVACGLAEIGVLRKSKVAVLSTGDELVALSTALGAAQVYDSNGAVVADLSRQSRI